MMKKLLNVSFLITFLASAIFVNLSATEKQEITKTFDKKESIDMRFVSGDCHVKRGADDKIHVHLVYRINPPDAFEPVFQEKGDKLVLKERFHDSSSGSSTWTLTVPNGIEIQFKSASGDFEIADLKCEIKVSTASGDVSIENSDGEFDVNTASGDVTIDNSKGEFDINTASGEIDVNSGSGEYSLNTASGDIDGKEVLVEEESSFSAASGDVYIALAKSPAYDLKLSSASGDAILNFNGNPIQGYFELTSKVRSGRIKSPFKFDNEEEFYRNDQLYVKKSFTKDKDTPIIRISTASGKAELREK
ncbi:MAG: DUF4097 family beta strand repeat protein [bacterium]|nr:MAG: DUF4097 family beta strand repeat protein [bacterium]